MAKIQIIQIEETCSHCDALVNVDWNLTEHGYVMYCPYCGKKMYLCNQCPLCSESNCNDRQCLAKIQELIKSIDKDIDGVENEMVYLNSAISLIEDLEQIDENAPLYIANCNIETFIDDFLANPLDCGCEFVEEVYTKYCIETKQSMTKKIENYFDKSTLAVDDINNIIFNFLMSQYGETFDTYLVDKEDYITEMYNL